MSPRISNLVIWVSGPVNVPGRCTHAQESCDTHLFTNERRGRPGTDLMAAFLCEQPQEPGFHRDCEAHSAHEAMGFQVLKGSGAAQPEQVPHDGSPDAPTLRERTKSGRDPPVLHFEARHKNVQALDIYPDLLLWHKSCIFPVEKLILPEIKPTQGEPQVSRQ